MAKIESLSELDEYYEEKKKEQRMRRWIPNKKVAIIIVIIGAIVLGFVVYRVVYKAMEEKNPEVRDYIGDPISVEDENIKILYDYVTYGADGIRNTKFVLNRNVDITSFSNKELIYYALQFAQVEDFEFTGEYDNARRKIYFIPDSKIHQYMKYYFGASVTMTPESSLEYPFTFSINKQNVGTMTHDNENNGYDTVFKSRVDVAARSREVQPVYGKLINALRKTDGSIVLQERVVYTVLRTDNGKYAVDIYKDPEKTQKLDTKSGLSQNDLSSFTVDPTTYPATAIVEYTFGWNGQTCFFQSSRIIL